MRTITNEHAKQEIENYLIKRKKKGLSTVDFIDIIWNLDLPGKQIHLLLKELENEGRISEVVDFDPTRQS